MLLNLYSNASFKNWPLAYILQSSPFLGCIIFFLNLVLCCFCCYSEAWGRSFLSSFSPITTRTNPGSGSDKASQAPTWATFLAEEIPQCSSCGRNLTISVCLQCLLTLWITAQAPQRPWLYSTRMSGKYCQKNNSPLSGAGDFQIWAWKPGWRTAKHKSCGSQERVREGAKLAEADFKQPFEILAVVAISTAVGWD